jgi:alanine racemase
MDFRMDRRPCWVEISTGAFEENYRLLVEACAPNADSSSVSASVLASTAVELLAIVKADAYGHGLDLCAPAAVRAGAQWLGVTSVEEGVAARAVCPDAEILAIGGVFEGQADAVAAHRITPVVWDHWQLRLLETAAVVAGYEFGSLRVHLELDTGMSRQGAQWDALSGLTSWFVPRSELHLKLDGLMTHLYAADERDGEATGAQMARLEAMVERVFASGLRPRWLHVGNSAAVLSGEPLRSLLEICGRFGMRPMARPGLALYGVAPEFTPDETETVAQLHAKLRPVLEWKTRVVSVRAIDPGEAVGYNGTFVATEPMRLALLAVGYADGLKRSLSNRGSVLVHGQRAPIVGRVSMDQTVVDVTEIPGVAAADEAVLLGRQGGESIPAEEHAAWAGTISWEIFTSIAARVERREIVTRE